MCAHAYFSGARYSALSLDSDISLRADPYPLLHRSALARRQLLVGLDSDAPSGTGHALLLFPGINVGLVYAHRCRMGGPAHTLLREVTRRAEAFLLGPTRFSHKSPRVRLPPANHRLFLSLPPSPPSRCGRCALRTWSGSRTSSRTRSSISLSACRARCDEQNPTHPDAQPNWPCRAAGTRRPGLLSRRLPEFWSAQ